MLNRHDFFRQRQYYYDVVVIAAIQSIHYEKVVDNSVQLSSVF
jgi:hypothetical protein